MSRLLMKQANLSQRSFLNGEDVKEREISSRFMLPESNRAVFVFEDI